MIMCDIQGVNCYKWYHGMCVGISPEEGRYMEKHNELYKFPSCAGVHFCISKCFELYMGRVIFEFCDHISVAYDQVVHWRNNLFMVPFGKAGTDFVTELSKLFQNYGTAPAMECIALKAAMVIPSLLLQRPHQNSKSHDHVICLEHRLPLWHDGNILDLLNESSIVYRPTKESDQILRIVPENLLNLCPKARLRLLYILFLVSLVALICQSLHRLGSPRYWGRTSRNIHHHLFPLPI